MKLYEYQLNESGHWRGQIQRAKGILGSYWKVYTGDQFDQFYTCDEYGTALNIQADLMEVQS